MLFCLLSVKVISRKAKDVCEVFVVSARTNYATTVSLIKLIFYVDKGTLMQTWKFCNIFIFRLTEATTGGVL